MQRDADSFITTNERAFIVKALQEDCRLDGRRPFDFRKPKLQFSLDDSSATLTLGTTRVLTVISASLEAPFPDRPNEGSLRFNAEFSPMASPAFEPGRPGIEAVELARLVERGLRGSGAVDTEALCVLAGRKVWALRCDMHVLDHGGNLVDACMLCALAACMAFRRPEVVVGGGPTGTDIVVQPKELREPIPLTIHHYPISTTFALYEDGTIIAVDPSLKEQAAQAGSATIMVNTNKEVCAVHKAEGIGLNSTQFMRLVRIATGKADDLVAAVKSALQAHEVARVQARVKRAQALVGMPQSGRHVTISAAAPPQPTCQQPPAQAQTDPELLKLEQDLDVSLDGSSDDASASSSSSEEEEDEEPSQPQSAAATDAQAQRATTGKGAGSSGKAEPMDTEKPPSKGKLKPAVLKPSPLPSAPQQQQQEQQQPGVQKAKKKRPLQQPVTDNLEAIASVIAGSKQHQPGEEEVGSLGDAVKHHKVQKKKR